MNISFEFFPPRSESAKERLDEVITQLKVINPEYFSVTFGAGGTTRESTFDTIKHISNDHGVPAVPHLSCVGSEEVAILELLHAYKALGVTKLVTLRGDIPSGVRDIGDFHYALDLVQFIRKHFNNDFALSVAAYPEKHPQARSYSTDFAHFLAKLEYANTAITQYFYNIDGYLHFRDEVAKVSDKPIIPGIMPIVNFDSLARFSSMCGAEIPRWMSEKFQGLSAEDTLKFGFEVVHTLCQNLKQEGVTSMHFYSMNKTHPNLELAKNLL